MSTRTLENMVFVDGVLTAVTVEVDDTVDTVTAGLAAKARTALTANQTFLNLSSPTNAQTLAQVKVLTREVTALIRLQGRVIDELSDLVLTDGGT